MWVFLQGWSTPIFYGPGDARRLYAESILLFVHISVLNSASGAVTKVTAIGIADMSLGVYGGYQPSPHSMIWTNYRPY